MKQVAIGIDIGGTNTVLGLVDQNGNVLVMALCCLENSFLRVLVF